MAQKKETSIQVPEIKRETAEFYVVGTEPLLYNAMSAKAMRELLFPSGRKTEAEKATNLKHDPLDEFASSVYRMAEGETLLGFPSPGFKKAMQSAALDVPGATKAKIGRLVRVNGYRVPIWGVPEVFTTAVRSADVGRTPDIRTRAIVPEWACRIAVQFVRPMLSIQAITKLLAAAGELAGIGDFRQEKGAGSFGSFRLTGPEDAEYLEITRAGGREEQELAMKSPSAFDEDTADLLAWFEEEVEARGKR